MQLDTTNTPKPGFPAREKNTVHPRSGQDLPGRKTRHPQMFGSPFLAQRGTVDKPAIDIHVDEVTTVRCRRSDCERAFRRRPERESP